MSSTLPTQGQMTLYRELVCGERYFRQRADRQPSFRKEALGLAKHYEQQSAALLEEYGSAIAPVPTVHFYEDYDDMEVPTITVPDRPSGASTAVHRLHTSVDVGTNRGSA